MIARLGGFSVWVMMMAARPAEADSSLADVSACLSFDRGQLERAIVSELASDAKGVVVVSCPDAVTAHLQWQPPGSVTPVARSLDLSDVPGGMRIRVIALAAAELFVTPTPTAPLGRPGNVRNVQGARKSVVNAGGSTTPVAQSPRDAAAFRQSPGETAALAPGALSSATLVERQSTMSPSRRAAVGVTWRVGAKYFVTSRHPMVEARVEATRGPLSGGAAVALGRATDLLGEATTLVATAGGGARILCTGLRVSACLGVRVAGGLALVAASPSSDRDLVASGVTATEPYAEAVGQVVFVRGWTTWGMQLLGEFGWAAGLIATAEDRDLAHLAGPTGTLSAGVSWR